MIIIGQDRKEIINFDNVMNIEICDCDKDGFGIFAGVIIGIDDNYRLLGYYKTEQRAKEVLKTFLECINCNMKNIPYQQADINVKVKKYFQFYMPEI